MMSEIAAAMQSVKLLNELVRAQKDLGNFNELAGAVYEVNAKLMAATAVALAAQEKQAALAQRIGELEKENEQLKNWERERERYQLTEIALGVFAYSLKPGMENGETAHLLCTNCFTDKKKAILQSKSPGRKATMFHCFGCDTNLPVEIVQMQTAKLVR